MHYKNGREAKLGDKVLLIPSGYGTPIVGILYDATAGNDHCNGRLAVTGFNDPMPDLKDCLHVDDVKAATIPDSSPKVAVLDRTPPEPAVTPVPPSEPAVLEPKPGCPHCGALEGHTRGCSQTM